MKISTICLVLVSSLLTGCTFTWTDPEPPEPCLPKKEIVIQERIVYIAPTYPEPEDKPEYIDYKMEYIKYNEKIYYQMSLEDGDTMLLNWDRYKIWAETNYKILIDLNKNKKDK